MRVDVVVGTRFSNRACSSFGNCTSLRAITEGEPRLVRTCSSFGNCTSLREPQRVDTALSYHPCSSFGNCTSLRDRVALGPVRVDRDPCSSFGNCTSLRVCLRPEEDRCLPLLQFFRELHFIEGLCLPRHRHWSSLQFFRELHFIEGAHQCAHNRMCGLQFFRELHFIEGRLSGGGFKPPCPCSSFGNCTSLRAWDHSVARTRLSIHSIIDR